MNSKDVSRRKFVTTSVTALTSIVAVPSIAFDFQEPLTIREVIDRIKHSISPDPIYETVDTVKSGNEDQPVSGIVSTMFATVEVIRKAAAAGANLIIAHEPTFYNHLDDTGWLKEHDVYKMKLALLEKHKIVIWRFHDYWHRNKPDGVQMGVLTKLGWNQYYNENDPRIVALPATRLSDIISHVKKKLGIERIRYIGDPSESCKRIALLPGAWGGRNHMNTIHESNPDLLICGELQEWETSEYIRDSRALGMKRSLIVLGHSLSEEPGMEWMVQWLQPKVPGIKITHIPSNNPFRFA